MKAEAGGQHRDARVAHPGLRGESTTVQLVSHLELEAEGIHLAGGRVVHQLEYGFMRGLPQQRETSVARKTMATERMPLTLPAELAAMQCTDDGKQDRRAAFPEGRVSVPQ